MPQQQRVPLLLCCGAVLAGFPVPQIPQIPRFPEALAYTSDGRRCSDDTAVSAAIATGRVQLANVRHNALNTARVRALWIMVLFIFATLTACVRIAQLGRAAGGRTAGASGSLSQCQRSQGRAGSRPREAPRREKASIGGAGTQIR